MDWHQKLKSFLHILPNHHLRISFQIVKTTKEHEHEDKCHSNQQQKTLAKERKHEDKCTQTNNKRRSQKRENMRCSSWLQDQHTWGTAETYLTQSTQMSSLHRPCPVSKYFYYIQNCPAILKLSHICIALHLHLGGGNQLISLNLILMEQCIITI